MLVKLAPGASARENIFGSQIQYTFGRALGLEARLEHRKRTGILPSDDYSELTGGLYLRYDARLGGQ